MLLKRKRSDDELSSFSPGGTGHGFASPVPSDNGDIDMVMMDTDTPLSPKTTTTTCIFSPTTQTRSRSCTPSHLPSRTFKRLRNGRPSDDEVHRPFLSWGMFPDSLLRDVRASTENTLKMLYQAQHHQPQEPQHHFSPPVQAVPMPPPQTPAAAAPVQNQPSLHSFWKLPAAPKPTSSTLFPASSAAPPSIDAMVDRPTSCEDCGVGLGGEDATMDDGYGFETFINTCSSCSKAVCFSCSISNLGEQRRCLACAGGETSNIGKKWVGGTGWTSEPVTVY
ncbi:hypothetical protein VMCG_09441 [Cytospora schulzeri]|uniref:Uncharacterized protein n=1 Tax=Cytospora schulzeri TaxID=448051 RepID=A0A423VKF1_9PEZI|nr:hypothetical protein VMCG_09441 [Valsa malicola]